MKSPGSKPPSYRGPCDRWPPALCCCLAACSWKQLSRDFTSEPHWVKRLILGGSAASLYSTKEKVANQSNRFVPRHFYIVKGKGPVKKLKLTSAVYAVWKASLKAACHTAWRFIIMEPIH